MPCATRPWCPRLGSNQPPAACRPSGLSPLPCQLSYAGMSCSALPSDRSWRAASLRCGDGTRTRDLGLMRPLRSQLRHSAVAPATLRTGYPGLKGRDPTHRRWGQVPGLRGPGSGGSPSCRSAAADLGFKAVARAGFEPAFPDRESGEMTATPTGHDPATPMPRPRAHKKIWCVPRRAALTFPMVSSQGASTFTPPGWFRAGPERFEPCN